MRVKIFGSNSSQALAGGSKIAQAGGIVIRIPFDLLRVLQCAPHHQFTRFSRARQTHNRVAVHGGKIIRRLVEELWLPEHLEYACTAAKREDAMKRV
jgi:hypothetical protein